MMLITSAIWSKRLDFIRSSSTRRWSSLKISMIDEILPDKEVERLEDQHADEMWHIFGAQTLPAKFAVLCMRVLV
jgi:hypothetical protein